MKFTYIFLFLIIPVLGFTQKATKFKPTQKIYIYDIKDTSCQNCLRNIPRTQKKPKIEYTTIYNGSKIVILKDSVPKFSTASTSIFNKNKFNYLKNRNFIKADVQQEGDKLIIHPWIYPNSKKDTAIVNLNKHLKDNILYINLEERRNLGISYSSWQLGALTMPFKIYLSSKEDTLRNNFAFDANFSIFIGKQWGKKRFTNFPHLEKQDEPYTTGYSLNGILGLSSLVLKATNTQDKLKKENTTAAFSFGISPGYQYKNIGIFTAMGLDIPLSEDGANWIFKNRPWLGFGVGYEL